MYSTLYTSSLTNLAFAILLVYTFSSSEKQIYCQMVYFYKVITRLQACVCVFVCLHAVRNKNPKRPKSYTRTANEPGKRASYRENNKMCTYSYVIRRKVHFDILIYFYALGWINAKWKWKIYTFVHTAFSHFSITHNTYNKFRAF